MHAKGIITYTAISKRLAKDPAFDKAKLGAAKTLHSTLNELIALNIIGRLSKAEIAKLFTVSAEGYYFTKEAHILTTSTHH